MRRDRARRPTTASPRCTAARPTSASPATRLGGGIGWYARKLGLASNSLTAVELVTADGEHVRADATQNRELFWALRGGGGNFGVVTALEFRLYPIETAYAGMLVWDRDHAERVLRRWADWAPEAPGRRSRRRSASSTCRRCRRSRSRCAAGRSSSSTGRCSAATREARSILGLLRGLGPEIDTFDRVPARSLTRLHMDPEGPTPGRLGRDAPRRARRRRRSTRSSSRSGPGRRRRCSRPSCASSAVRSAGRPRATVPSRRSTRHTPPSACAIAATPEMAMQGQLDAHQFTGALEPWSTGRSYLNFAENEVDARTGYAESAWVQLKGIRLGLRPGRPLRRPTTASPASSRTAASRD